MNSAQPTDEWIEEQAGVTDEVAEFIFTSKSAVADRAWELYDKIRTDFDSKDMDEFKILVRKIKTLMFEDELKY